MAIINAKLKMITTSGIDDGQRAETHEFAHGMNVVGQARHQIAGLAVLKIAERQFLQMGEHHDRANRPRSGARNRGC